MDNLLKEIRVKRWCVFFILVSILFSVSEAALPASITCQDDSDVYIDEWHPDDNFNYKTRLLVATNGENHHGIARSLLRFDIPTELEAGSIGSASIYFSPCASCGGGNGGWVGFYALNQSFDEVTVTWNTFPVDGSWDDSVFATAVLPGGTDWNQAVNGEPPPDAQGINLTALLKGNLEKVRQNGIMMRFLDEHQLPSTHQNLASRESQDSLDFHPIIVIEEQAASCSAWSDVIAKYNSYVSGAFVWSDVITCYQQYSSLP
jgi:hypothetical protein